MEKTGETYNIGGKGNERTNLKIVDTIAKFYNI